MKTLTKTSKYWDDFERRITETVNAVKCDAVPPLRRICLHITSKCNFNCQYCNEKHENKTLPVELFDRITKEYSQMGGGILHITGGEPSVVKWLPDGISRCPSNVTVNFNTNCYKLMPLNTYNRIGRIKVSLDTDNAIYFNELVNKNKAFETVINNLNKLSFKAKDISITYTMTKQNYANIPNFLKFFYTKLPRMYAVFFSTYKGNNKDFVFSEDDMEKFWGITVPQMKELFIENNDQESLWLFENSYNQDTLRSDIRFPENLSTSCYLSKSELVVNENGDTWRCSHLFRDKVDNSGLNIKDYSLNYIHNNIEIEQNEKCLYGCNLKLINFNKQVEDILLKGE